MFMIYVTDDLFLRAQNKYLTYRWADKVIPGREVETYDTILERLKEQGLEVTHD